ncbi:MAG: hypothetical protein K1060chlam4_00330 [Candidatus Anoxychlamydiales bacterium]|nr:hypothetical protein [Candidatus Anoxychlamydiales bacterium]
MQNNLLDLYSDYLISQNKYATWLKMKGLAIELSGKICINKKKQLI